MCFTCVKILSVQNYYSYGYLSAVEQKFKAFSKTQEAFNSTLKSHPAVNLMFFTLNMQIQWLRTNLRQEAASVFKGLMDGSVTFPLFFLQRNILISS